MNFKNPITFLEFKTSLVIPPPSPNSPVKVIKTTIKLCSSAKTEDLAKVFR